MKKTTPGGIWYATDPDPRAYAEQMQAQALSAETAFAVVDTQSQDFANYGTATIIPPALSVVNTTNLQSQFTMTGATVTKYGDSFFNTNYFGNSTLQFDIDGWVYLTMGVIFTESTAPSANQQRAAAIYLNRNSAYPVTQVATANRTFTSNLNPQIGTGVQVAGFFACHAGDTINFKASCTFSAGTVSAAARISLSYIGPLVLTP